MKASCLLSPTILLFCGCATLNDSLKLGAGVGALTGAAATFSAETAAHGQAKMENVALSAGIGAGIGILTSYLVHRSVESERSEDSSAQFEMHFGDLPPSPFIMPKTKAKKGGAK